MAKKVDTAAEFHIELNRCLPWLIEALDHSHEKIAIKDVLRGLVERDYQLWTTEHAAAVTAITRWSERTVCCLFIIGGVRGNALREVLAATPTLEEYARTKGCTGLLGIGRASWLCALKRIGFQEVQQNGDAEKVYFKGI